MGTLEATKYHEGGLTAGEANRAPTTEIVGVTLAHTNGFRCRVPCHAITMITLMEHFYPTNPSAAQNDSGLLVQEELASRMCKWTVDPGCRNQLLKMEDAKPAPWPP